jgi:hypothetical protein
MRKGSGDAFPAGLEVLGVRTLYEALEVALMG